MKCFVDGLASTNLEAINNKIGLLLKYPAVFKVGMLARWWQLKDFLEFSARKLGKISKLPKFVEMG